MEPLSLLKCNFLQLFYPLRTRLPLLELNRFFLLFDLDISNFHFFLKFDNLFLTFSNFFLLYPLVQVYLKFDCLNLLLFFFFPRNLFLSKTFDPFGTFYP